jgi:glycosyltransferase involved in cell wall biosynthesis
MLKKVADRALVVAFPHPPASIGGPGSFQSRLERKLTQDGHVVVYAGKEDGAKLDVVLVVGGTGKLIWLIIKKMQGVKIVHRLDGKNWQQTIAKDGFSASLKSRLINWMIESIKFFLANSVIFQSNFIAQVWRDEKCKHRNHNIIYNSVSLDEFRPVDKKKDNNKSIKVVCIEGSVNGKAAIDILCSIRNFQVNIYGNVSKEIQDYFALNTQDNIFFHGPVERDAIPEKLKGLKVFLNLETNPPCPNAVIEALASGVPVVGFDSGSLLELVGDAGVILPYGSGDPWKMESPDCKDLEGTLQHMTLNYNELSLAARNRAVCLFSDDYMYQEYLRVFKSI